VSALDTSCVISVSSNSFGTTLEGCIDRYDLWDDIATEEVPLAEADCGRYDATRAVMWDIDLECRARAEDN